MSCCLSANCLFTFKAQVYADIYVKLHYFITILSSNITRQSAYTRLDVVGIVFNVRQSTSHVIDIGWTSVRLSVTHWYCVETAQPIVKLRPLPGSLMILVF